MRHLEFDFCGGPGAPDLASYDLILVNSSGGKDSMAMLAYLVELADKAGVRERLVMAHADLGRVEWKGTRELVEEHAAHSGLRLEVVKRNGKDLLEHVRERRMWPDNKNRYCTSDHKRDPIARIVTKITREVIERLAPGRPVRVLNCMGLRAEESPARAKRASFSSNKRLTNGKRIVDEWLPIHGWKIAEVWARVKASGLRPHYAYALGMPRLSCVFCIFAPKAALVLAGKHNRELLSEYATVEREIGHTFRKDLAIADIEREVEAGAATEPAAISDAWNM